MNKTISLWIGCMLIGSFVFAANLPLGFVEQVLVDGLNPVAMTIDHHGNIWLVEKDGKVLIVNDEGNLLPDPFIQLAVDDYNERGLLGIALHPDFDNNPYVYLYYTVPTANHNRVSRFLANGNLAVPGSEEILMDLDMLPGFVHNGGAMIFGPDSMLYIATGEGAHAPFSQDLNNLNGKILRLNANGSIPTDNPFYKQLSEKNRAIWAYGLRNPFSFDIDPLSGDFYTIDVGGGEFEEINVLSPGKNYGWPQVEGPIDGQNPPVDYMDPIYAYDHEKGCSIVGAAFNRLSSTSFPSEYYGHFFFADYCDGYIKSLDPQTGMVSLFADQINRPLAIEFDHEKGKMYYLTRAGIGGGSQADNTSTRQGQLWEVQFVGNGSPFVSVHPESDLISHGEDATFQVQASGAEPLSYQWFQNDNALVGENQARLNIYAPSLADSGNVYYCIVSNGEGLDTSRSAVLGVTSNQRPSPVIELPVLGAKFQAGDTLHFSGTAFDPEEGELASDRLSWLIVWHHEDHTHPGAGPFEGTNSGFWVVPTVNETDTSVWYRVHLTAVDMQGMSRTTTMDLFPQISAVHIEGPPGVEMNIDGRIRTLPHTFYSLIGLERVVEAIPTTIIGDKLFRFKRWSDSSIDRFWQGSAPEEGMNLRLEYDSFDLGTGTGLWGSYYNDSLLGFETVPVLERHDSTINFLWGNASPEANIVQNDFFTARWTGEIHAIFNEVYTFYVRSDDGIRLWIGNELVIDKWVPQATTENEGEILLEAGKRYPIRLEYFEKDGGAEMVLAWSSPSTLKEVIPKRQLYPEAEIIQARISGEIWIDLNKNKIREREEVPLAGIPVLLKLKEDSSIIASLFSDDAGQFQFIDVPPAAYFIQALPSGDGKFLSGLGTIDYLGRSQVLLTESGDILFIPLPFQEVDKSFFQPFVDVKVYPNPATEFLHVQFTQLRTEQIRLEIIGMQGQRLLSREIFSKAGKQGFEIDIKDLSSGIYVLRMVNSLGSYYRKIVKF